MYVLDHDGEHFRTFHFELIKSLSMRRLRDTFVYWFRSSSHKLAQQLAEVNIPTDAKLSGTSEEGRRNQCWFFSMEQIDGIIMMRSDPSTHKRGKRSADIACNTHNCQTTS